MYYDAEFRKDRKFVTVTLEKDQYDGNKAGAYIVPIHDWKTEESDFTEHMYYHEMKPLLKYKVMHNNQKRFYCRSCNKMAREIKNEVLRPSKAEECKSCHFGLR
jgi:hypothetical protein